MADLAEGAEDQTRRPEADVTQRAPLPEPAVVNDPTKRVDEAATRLAPMADPGATVRPESPAMPARPAPDDSTLPPGTVLGHTYVIEDFLARGGMGEVYRARHRELGSQHAIKIIRSEVARDDNIVRLFTEEAKKLRRVRDDAVVAYEGLFLDENGRRYLVMEFVDGPSLAQRLRSGPLPIGEVRSLRDRIALGLGAAHAKGIFHRDLSPDNVILVDGKTERAKVIDFGIAKSTDPGDVTVVGDSFAGKYSWVAPEQLGLFGGKVDARADIYSLGLLLASAAIGRPISPAGSLAETVAARSKLPDLSLVPAALKAELEPLLQPDPARRPLSMTALPRLTGAQRRDRRVVIGSIAAIVLAVVGAGGAVGWRLYTTRPALDTPDLPAGPPDRAASLKALGPVLSRFDCAGLTVAGTGADGITLGGFVSRSDDIARVMNAAAPLTRGFQLVNRIEVTPPPFCTVRQLTDGIGNTAGTEVATDHADHRYRFGDPLIVTIKPPPRIRRGWLMLDFIEADGSVWHLNSVLESGQPITVGAASGDLANILGEPSGPKMLLAVVSDKQLPPVKLGEKDDGATYLPRLREQLAAATASGAAVSVASLPIEVAPK